MIKKAIEDNIEVIPIPGACAMINALIASGISTKEFEFLGFLPLNKKLRRQKLKEIENSSKTIIIYEAPHKMKTTLGDLKEILKDRKIGAIIYIILVLLITWVVLATNIVTDNAKLNLKKIHFPVKKKDNVKKKTLNKKKKVNKAKK